MFNRYYKNEAAFTLIEMMIVLMIISVLLLITIPNVTKNNTVVKDKGCEALVKLVEAQVQAYEIEKNERPTSLETLKSEGYIKTYTCPSGGDVQFANGVVSAPSSGTSGGS
ncbi:MAG TPA: prepilin-type N-terminal cleavage/methylation domain-containing protein [Bacillus bacterium]|nr:prepilin-type N-terminal cleavage/methylation domain-containing protein [Bacillus sp. (in: firmicutes)]